MNNNSKDLDKYMPYDPIKELTRDDYVEVATAYFYINGHLVDNNPSNRIAIASVVITDEYSFRILEKYLADECRKVYPVSKSRQDEDSDTLRRFNIKIHNQVVLRDAYRDQGFSLTGITTHRDIHDYIRKVSFYARIRLLPDRCADFIHIENLILTPLSYTLTESDLNYIYVGTDSTKHFTGTPYMGFKCVCDLTHVAPENYRDVIDDAIKARLRDQVIPCLHKYACKLTALSQP